MPSQAPRPPLAGLPAGWLRDNCPCPLCRDPVSGQRLLHITDIPADIDVAEAVSLHCLHNAADGGDSGFVDGFHAAAALRAQDPAAFATLAVTPVTFGYRDATTELSATRPLISLDARGRIREIRINPRSLQPVRLPGPQATAFYAAYRTFAQLLGAATGIIRRKDRI
jgi:gamma-butyrobetaine dioxygenase